jgi:hypothetical protein
MALMFDVEASCKGFNVVDRRLPAAALHTFVLCSAAPSSGLITLKYFIFLIFNINSLLKYLK